LLPPIGHLRTFYFEKKEIDIFNQQRFICVIKENRARVAQ
jgi:hypothetical protein